MRHFSIATTIWTALGIVAAMSLSGCMRRTDYRVEADHDAYHVIAERNVDPRWEAPSTSIELDPRSRYFDPYHPDHPPMPADDPAAHEYMHVVNGMKGWKYWHDNGVRHELENPAWREALGGYADVKEDGTVRIDVDSALRLAYIHSPFHQRQLETLYLSALDVSAERFRLDTQFFGGYDAQYVHAGSLIPPTLFALATPTAESNRLTVGRPFAADPALQLSKQFATAGELLAGFANSFVFEFTDGDLNLASSLASFSIVQPLLRGAGRDIALEQLTFEERNLLNNLRSYSQFRQGFYTQVAIGELGVNGPQRFGSGTTLQSFSGFAPNTGGYYGLLQQYQLLRNARDILGLQERTLVRLQVLYDNDFIDLVQLDQFRQSVESQKAEVLVRENSLELALDNYKTGTLGLPPDLAIELDQSLISQFQLFPPQAVDIQTDLLKIREELALLPEEPEVDVLAGILNRGAQIEGRVEALFELARQELAKMDATVPQRESSMNDEEKSLFQTERERLYRRLTDLKSGFKGFDETVEKLKALRAELGPNTRARVLTGATSWTSDFIQVVERLALVPAQARLEVIMVEPLQLGEVEAFQVALASRLDFMNGRAALVDRWRLVQVNADALQAILNVTAGGDVGTSRDNPFSFRSSTGSLRMGVEFDAPFTRLLERNAYRESLIEYQRARRAFIQSRDGLQLSVRALLRNLKQLRRNLEIQRRALTIAIRRVDQTQLLLNPARPPMQPGTRPPINPTTSINLLGAQSSLQSTQNAFLQAWIAYYATRMRLYRELGIMVIDPDGRWMEYPIESDPELEAVPGGEELPPPMPAPMPTPMMTHNRAAPVDRANNVRLVGYFAPGEWRVVESAASQSNGTNRYKMPTP